MYCPKSVWSVGVVVGMSLSLGAAVPTLAQQGGEDCSAPSVLHDPLPIRTSGTTVGYADDYDEVCPFGGSLAPDVVYSYAPSADVTVDISLCAGLTDFDTKLYVYEGVCPDLGQPYACNDDACYTPSGQGMVSAIRQLPLLAGHTYYIVVDGYGMAAGFYELEIAESVPPPDCGGGLVLSSQLPELEEWVAAYAGAHDDGLARYEYFENASGRIIAVRFWGLNFHQNREEWEPAPAGPMEFTIRVLEDQNGEPGYEIALLNLELTPTVVGTVGPQRWEVLEYYTALSPAPFAHDFWISVEGPGLHADEALFAWLGSCAGDGASYCGGYGGPYIPAPCAEFDLALCLYTDGEEILGACCDDLVGVCREDVPAGECTGRFLANQSCADFDPPCATPEGACCHADGTCAISTFIDCEGAPGSKGDLNCDGYKNFDDIEPFVLALVDQGEYEGHYPGCDWLNADCNLDGVVSFDDINAFVTTLAVGSGNRWLGPDSQCEWCDPEPIMLPAELPYGGVGFTCNRGNDFDDTALGDLDRGDDVVYELVITEAVAVTIVLESARYYFPAMLLSSTYPPGDEYVALAADPVEGQVRIDCLYLEPGQYYLLIDSWSPPECLDDFYLQIQPCAPPVGRCCYGEPVECVEVMEHECAELDGWWDADLDCGTPCFVDGDDCASAIEIVAPTSMNLDSPFYGADGPAGPCDKYGSGHLMQRDVWLRWTPPDSGVASVTVGSATDEFDPVLVVRSGCGEADVLRCSDRVAGAEVQEFVQFPFTANTTYYFQVGEAGPHPSGEAGNLSFQLETASGAGGCCLSDGTCLEMSVHNCVTVGGFYLGDGEVCGPESCPQPEPGDSCGDVAALTVTADVLPLTVVGSTAGRSNEYSDTCLGSYDSGRDVVYRLTVPEPVVVNIRLNPGSVEEEPGTPFTGFALSGSCPPTDCIVTARNAEGMPYGVEYVVLREGTYYLMVDKWLLPDEIPEFELVIEVADDDTGACCLGDECVGVITLAECMAVEGRWDRGASCSWGQPCEEEYGDTCETPEEIYLTGNGVEVSSSTIGYGNAYVGETCLGIADGGRDIVYKLIVPEPETRLVEVSLSTDWPAWGHMWVVLSDSCPPVEGACLARVLTTGASAPLELAPGEYYLMVDMWPVRTEYGVWLDRMDFELTVRALDGL